MEIDPKRLEVMGTERLDLGPTLIIEALGADLCVPEHRPYERKGADLEQFIQIIGSVAAWEPLKWGATAYIGALLGTLGHETGLGLWKAGREALDRKPKDDPFSRLIEACEKAAKTEKVTIGISAVLALDGVHFGARLELAPDDKAESARRLACVLARMDDIRAAVDMAIARGNGPAFSVFISVKPDRSIVLRWRNPSDVKETSVRLDPTV